jgi:hypothetical protein
MKRFGLAIAALLAALAFGAPPSAFAADKPTPYTKEQITQGKKEAPAIAQAAGATCTITDAAYIGQSTAKDDKGKDIKQSVYEVSCQEGLGYALIAPLAQTPKAYDCVALLGNTSLSCKLPENADPKKGLIPIVAQTGSQCTMSDARYLGSKPTGETYYEVGCGSEPGFLLQTAHGVAPKVIGCDQVSGAMACKFTNQAQLDAATKTKAAALLAKANQPTCQLSNARSIGELQNGDLAFEVACQSGTGFVLEAAANGDFKRAISCGNAGDACKLTDATKAESAEAGTYTHLATAGGFQCQVGKYRFIGIDNKTNSEVVELQCSNRPDGVIAAFPEDNKGPAKFYDCVQAGVLGQSCKLTDPSATFGKYTQALASKGKTTCKVSSAKWLGQTSAGESFIETGCSDGLPGWVIAQSTSGSVSELLSCGQAKASGVACTLPGNTK